MPLAAGQARLCAARPYHHGNVRGRLTAVARRLLEEQGEGALSLRAISAEAGVALGTIYHHYDGKAALLAQLAVEGFEELAARMAKAFAERGEGGGLRATGTSYVRFLFKRPALYRLMFEALDQGGRPEVAAAERRAFAVVAGSIRADRGLAADSPLADEIATAIWAWGRGLAALGFSGGLQAPRPERVEAAVRGLEALIAPTGSDTGAMRAVL